MLFCNLANSLWDILRPSKNNNSPTETYNSIDIENNKKNQDATDQSMQNRTTNSKVCSPQLGDASPNMKTLPSHTQASTVHQPVRDTHGFKFLYEKS